MRLAEELTRQMREQLDRIGMVVIGVSAEAFDDVATWWLRQMQQRCVEEAQGAVDRCTALLDPEQRARVSAQEREIVEARFVETVALCGRLRDL